MSARDDDLAAAVISGVLQARTDEGVFKAFGFSVNAASPSEHLRKCFFRAALRVHPDKCGQANAEDAFKRLSAAHEALAARVRPHGAAATPKTADEKWGIPKKKKKKQPQHQHQHQHQHQRAAKSKWWKHASWTQIAEALAKEEAAFAPEMAAAVTASKQRAAGKKAAKQRKRKQNEQKVNAGLEALRQKYRIQPTEKTPTGNG